MVEHLGRSSPDDELQVIGPTVGRHRYCGQRWLLRVKCLRLFMTVWLSIFPDHIWLDGTLPSSQGPWEIVTLIAQEKEKV